MKTTFINQNSENTIVEAGEKHLNSRALDFEAFMNAQDLENVVIDNENYSFYDYGLSFDYVELGTFDDQEEDYFRYQLSWGGPSEEIRFYEDGTIIFVYLDWFSGVGFDVTETDWAQWLKYWFEGCDSLNFSREREKYDYYEQIYELENE